MAKYLKHELYILRDTGKITPRFPSQTCRENPRGALIDRIYAQQIAFFFLYLFTLREAEGL